MEQIIDFPVKMKIKEECLDEEYTYLPPLTPSEALEENHLYREFKTECGVEVNNNQQVNCLNESDRQLNNNFTELANDNYYHDEDGSMCLDETDGKFKRYEDVVTNQTKTYQGEDLKNYCSECNVQYDSSYASAKHFLFAHSNLYQLGYLNLLPNKVAGPQPLKNCISCNNDQQQNVQTNMETFIPSQVIEPQVPKNISEPVTPKLPIKKYKSILKAKVLAREQKPYSNTHISQKHYVFKEVMGFPKNLNNLIPDKELQIPPKTNNLDKQYTKCVSSIKKNPVKGIKIVKKSEIPCNESQIKAKESLMQIMMEHNYNKKANGIISLSTPTYICSETQRYQGPSCKEVVKFRVHRCILVCPGVMSFDSHMLTFVCEFCSNTFHIPKKELH